MAQLPPSLLRLKFVTKIKVIELNESIFSDRRYNRVDKKRKLRRIIAWTYDNQQNLPDDYIPSLLSKYGDNKNLVRSHVYGEFTNLVGKAACPDFNRDIHVVTAPPDHYSPLIFSWDFNVDPLAWVVIQQRWIQTGLSRTRVEVIVGNSSGNESLVVNGTVEFSQKFPVNVYRRTPIKIDGDSQGHRRDVMAAGTPFKKCKETLLELGYENVEIVAGEFNPPEEDTIEETNQAFSERKLFIHYECENAIMSCEQSQLQEGKRKLLKVASDTVTHWFDAIKYPVFRIRTSDSFGLEHRNKNII